MDRPHVSPWTELVGGQLSRRSTLRGLVAGLAAAALSPAVPAPRPSMAQVATPAADAFPDLSGVAPLPLTGARLATFESYIAAKLAEVGVPGAAVAVVQGGEVAFLQGFGVRELGQPAPVTAETLLRIGSVTKSFSSLLAATLVDTGRISWETPLVDLLPDFAVADPALTPRLTVADAFCACTGLPRRDWEIVVNAHALTPELVIAGMARLPLTAPYGEKYQYSNQMVAAGGFAAAIADGGSPHDLSHAYAIALRERVLNPIGMERSTLDLSDVVAGNDYAAPHAADIAGALRPLPLLEDDWVVPVAPSGGLWSSAREMVRYVQTELQHGVAPNGVRVVSAENLERTWQPETPMPAPPAGAPPETATYAQHYSLGWVVGAFGGQRVVWHGGATLGFHSLVTVLPEAGLGVVVLTNGSVGVAGPFNTAVTIRLLELLFELPAAIDATVTAGLAAVAAGRAALLAQLGQIDPAAVTPYLGQYANPDLGEATLALQAETLTFEVGGYRSPMRPQLDAGGAVAGYLFVDPPLGGFPPEFTVTFERDAADGPRLLLAMTGGPGEADLVYPFAPAGAAATPAP